MSVVIKAVAFDIGYTIVSYKNPLNLQSLYRDALLEVLLAIGAEADSNRIQAGEVVLLKYNTRVNNREYEVDSNTIFSELFRKWNFIDSGKIEVAKKAFYSFIQKSALVYDDTVEVLSTLRRKGYGTGALTDVAYGMDREYVLQDIAGIAEYFDVVLTSRDVGFRKPSVSGYLQLAGKLNTVPGEFIFVGDEEKDIIGANRAGMLSVLIDRERQNKDYGQKHTIESMNGLLKLL